MYILKKHLTSQQVFQELYRFLKSVKINHTHLFTIFVETFNEFYSLTSPKLLRRTFQCICTILITCHTLRCTGQCCATFVLADRLNSARMVNDQQFIRGFLYIFMQMATSLTHKGRCVDGSLSLLCTRSSLFSIPCNSYTRN